MKIAFCSVILLMVLTIPCGHAGEVSADALDKMVVVFEGDHSRAEIKSNLDRAFALYGIAETEENYNRFGSVLVALSNESNMTEMQILKCVVHGGSVPMEFGEMAALCVTLLSNS